MTVPLWPKGGIKNSGIPGFVTDPAVNEIDLRQEFIDLIDGDGTYPQRGHWVLLRRADKRQRCYCWNERGKDDEINTDDNRKYGEPKEDCLICTGLGWIYHDELHLSRRRLISPAIGLATEEVQAPIGIMNIQYVVYYFKYNVIPKKEDQIIEIKLNSNGDIIRPYVHREVFDISVAEPFRDITGRIEYWRAAAKMEAV